ncbi:MAG: flavodoxin family protein [Phascolarctobacterium sp.]|nr:flavodoxin family protein [Phascolarctobacterium sp.]
MKVILVNGSPHKDGCTNAALSAVSAELEKENIETEIFWIGAKPVGGCMACGGCAKTGKCVLGGVVADFCEKAADADGFIFGSPVHYAGIAGNMKGFLDRVFFSGQSGNGRIFRLKPAAAVVSARRAGTTATFDGINKYFTIAEMYVVSSRYWNMVHGFTAEDVKKDAEGLYTMRILARNMAWLLKSIKAANVPPPETEDPVMTNFIR